MPDEWFGLPVVESEQVPSDVIGILGDFSLPDQASTCRHCGHPISPSRDAVCCAAMVRDRRKRMAGETQRAFEQWEGHCRHCGGEIVRCEHAEPSCQGWLHAEGGHVCHPEPGTMAIAEAGRDLRRELRKALDRADADFEQAFLNGDYSS